MSPIFKLAVRTGLLAVLLLLTACSAPTPTAAPTQDINPIRTEVAATVLAQVPQLCALTPTVTPTPTTTPTVTPTLTATVTPTGLVSGTPGTVVAGPDKAKWVSQTVTDGTRFAPGAKFNMTWRIQNVGTSTWTVNYRMRFYSGDPFGALREIPLDREVKPGETVDITIAMTAPAKAGEYRSDWVMSNELLRNFNEPVFLKITVAAPGAATATSTTAPAATATATGEVVPSLTSAPTSTTAP